jgi:hypothetical protein
VSKNIIDARTGTKGRIIEMRPDGWVTVAWANGVQSAQYGPLSRGTIIIIQDEGESNDDG